MHLTAVPLCILMEFLQVPSNLSDHWHHLWHNRVSCSRNVMHLNSPQNFMYCRYLTIAAGIGSGSHFNYPHSIVGMLLVLLAFVFQPLAVWLGLQTSIPELKDFRSFFRSLHRRNGQMLVFFGIANIFLGFLALDTVNASPNYTQNLKIAYGIVVGIMIMAYMLFQPNTATFKVHSLQQNSLCFDSTCSLIVTVFLQRGDARAKWDAFVRPYRSAQAASSFTILDRLPKKALTIRATLWPNSEYSSIVYTNQLDPQIRLLFLICSRIDRLSMLLCAGLP